MPQPWLWQMGDRILVTPLTALYSWVVSASHATSVLASLPPRPFHVCTPPPRVRTSKTAAYLTQLTVSSRACGDLGLTGYLHGFTVRQRCETL
jgi:hypothetical protein